MKTSELLRAAQELIRDKSKWTRGAYGRDAAGESVDDVDSITAAESFCALGAVHFVSGDEVDEGPWFEALRRAAIIAGESSVVSVNDVLGHDAVMKMFDRAIEIAEAEESQ